MPAIKHGFALHCFPFNFMLSVSLASENSVLPHCLQLVISSEWEGTVDPVDLGSWQEYTAAIPTGQVPPLAMLVGGFTPAFLSASGWIPPWTGR